MEAVNTLVPVFTMMLLGMLARIKGWITPEQKAGANQIVFSILFPIMIFNVIFTSSIQKETLSMIVFVFCAWLVIYMVGKALHRWTGEEYQHISPYMLTVVEGGNVALPLYVSIVGSAYAINTVTFDMAGTVLCFVVFPIFVAKQGAGNVGAKELAKQICSSSFVIAVTLGLVANLTGLYNLLSFTAFLETYAQTMNMITGPIIGMILFIIGYDFKLERSTIKPLLKLMLLKIAGAICIIAGLFFLFPLSREMQIAVLIYFMSPTGFGLPIVISKLYRDEKDASFVSSFISVFMIVTLVVYTGIVLFFH